MAEAPRSRPPNAEQTRAEILDIATTEFARHGFAGARVDEIAALTRTTKRMIYYYFGGKEQLYLAVLERAFTVLGPAGGAPVDSDDDPLGAIVRLTGLTYDRYRAHPDFGRVLVSENAVGGERFGLAISEEAVARAGVEVARLEHALTVGAERGLIRAGVGACDLLMIIDGLCQFAISNRYTHHRLCGHDPMGEAFAETGRRVLADVVTAYLSPFPRS